MYPELAPEALDLFPRLVLAVVEERIELLARDAAVVVGVGLGEAALAVEAGLEALLPVVDLLHVLSDPRVEVVLGRLAFARVCLVV